VYGNQRAVYNVGARFSGSVNSSQYFDSPTGVRCGYALLYPKDEPFLGASEVILDYNLAERDPTTQMQQLAFWLAKELSLPSHHRRFVHLQINGVAELCRGNPSCDLARACCKSLFFSARRRCEPLLIELC